MSSRRKGIILKQNLMGDWIDDDGNRYNERNQRIDYLGRVIPEPWEEPATSSLGNGGARAFQPQTLADYNCPYLSYHKRAEIQAEIDSLNEEPPEQDFQFQNCGFQSKGWNDTPLQVQEAPVRQYTEAELDFLQLLERLKRDYEANKRLEEVSQLAGNTEERHQEEETQPRVEEKADLDYFGLVSVDTVVSVDRQTPTSDERDEISAKSEIWESSEEVSVDRSECVDRQEGFSGQSTSLFVHLSTDIVVSVDRHEPMLPENDVLESIDEAEPQPEPPIHVPDLPDPAHELKPPEPDPKPPEHHEIEVIEVLPKEAATPGSCHKRKLPDTTFQIPLKRIRSHTGTIAVILPATYLIDPGDTYAVYSRGPRPPPPLRYELSTPLSSPAGKNIHPPRRAHPVPATYLIDPEKTYAVYHLGPRPP